MYTNYSMWLFLASLILLLAMVGSIVITLKTNYSNKVLQFIGGPSELVSSSKEGSPSHSHSSLYDFKTRDKFNLKGFKRHLHTSGRRPFYGR